MEPYRSGDAFNFLFYIYFVAADDVIYPVGSFLLFNS